jgi:pyruvate-ferredoxin/flavodoxin oxidoreductase
MPSVVCDANEVVASVAYRLAEVIAIYPITPASSMGESADAWAAAGRPNLWGEVPRVVEMQSEAGAAGVAHGAAMAGALATSFTASQGLLLMIPELYKLAGELTPFVLHVAARAVATHALSIFGDHSDVMACRQTGVAMLASASPQEAQDFAAIAHAASLRSRVPFLHFFDGFRTSHEVSTIAPLEDDVLRSLVDEVAIAAHRARALSPDHPVIRGTAQNPDAFFQAREAANPFHDAVPDHVHSAMDALFSHTGRRYDLVEYTGDREAERVVVAMGSGAEVAEAAVWKLREAGERVGLVKVRLFRPFPWRAFVAALPRTVRAIAVLDRTKEPGAIGDPLWHDVVGALAEARMQGVAGPQREPRVVGVRYGLAGKEFSPAMARAALEALREPEPRTHVTVGIRDDVGRRSLAIDAGFRAEPEDCTAALFVGLGSDGTVSATQRALDAIGQDGRHFVQGYSIYDSKKSGSVTQTFVRIGARKIAAPWLPPSVGSLAIAHAHLLEKLELLPLLEPGGTVILGARGEAASVFPELPREVQAQLIEREARLWVVDLEKVASETGLPGRLGALLTACWFSRSGVLGDEEWRARMTAALTIDFGHRPEVLAKNLLGIDRVVERMVSVPLPVLPTNERTRAPAVPKEAPSFVQRVTSMLLEGKGDLLPVSAFPPDGTWPTGTSKWEKRRLARELPVWAPELCVACNLCTLLCPHSAIRAKVVPQKSVPEGLTTIAWKAGELAGQRYALAVSPDDCTGCSVCVEVCPAHDKKDPSRKSLAMAPVEPTRASALASFERFEALPKTKRTSVHLDVKGGQLLEPLFEYSGACSGCGETPYLKLISQLFGDRALIANATGCSSIFGGNLPTTPWCKNDDGRGPAWANSLFEDDAEFGLGFRLAVDAHASEASRLLTDLAKVVGADLVAKAREPVGHDEAALEARRALLSQIEGRLPRRDDAQTRRLRAVLPALLPRSVWIVGGDGWAYDIGFGGLDHVLASGADVNVLVLDTEVYSNTGGQQSKATPLGATARFAARGRELGKKDLGLMAMTYGHVYVAQIALGAKPQQAMNAIREAESHPGPSLVIAYSPCIAHGYDLGHGPEQQRRAVEAGAWPLFRFDPRRIAEGKPPLTLDAGAPTVPLAEYMDGQTRFSDLRRKDPARHARLLESATDAARRKRWLYERLAELNPAAAQAKEKE